ncbi:MAG: helix-turn-helix domain-containing protein [Mycobacterium sp.]
MGAPARYDDAAISENSAVVLSRLSERLGEITRAIQQRLIADVPELRDDSALVELLGASVEGNVDMVFHGLRYQIPIDKMKPPTAALEYSRRMAQRGVPMNPLVRAYRLGHELLLEFGRDEITDAGLDPRMSLAVFERMTAQTFRYVDWISQEVVVEYERERERWLDNRNSARAVRVREVLAATDVDLDAITAAIRYPMRRIHLGLVLWLPEQTAQGDELVRLEGFLRELTESLQTQGSPLFVAADRVSGWGWIPLNRAAADTAVADVRRFVANHDDSPSVALGSPLPGVEGFRRSHRQAQRARNVVLAAGADAASVTAADDPGLAAAALLGNDLEEARAWVREVLGPLSSDTENDARLRETLRVFLHHGASYKAAADQLNLHFNSVKYRVQRAVERRGRSIGEDRLDVELALLVCRWFGEAVLLSTASEK